MTTLEEIRAGVATKCFHASEYLRDCGWCRERWLLAHVDALAGALRQVGPHEHANGCPQNSHMVPCTCSYWIVEKALAALDTPAEGRTPQEKKT